MILDYGNYGMFLIVGNAGFISSTVGTRKLAQGILSTSWGGTYPDHYWVLLKGCKLSYHNKETV